MVLQTLVVNWDFVGGSRGAYILRPEEVPLIGSYIKYLFLVMLGLCVVALATAFAALCRGGAPSPAALAGAAALAVLPGRAGAHAVAASTSQAVAERSGLATMRRPHCHRLDDSPNRRPCPSPWYAGRRPFMRPAESPIALARVIDPARAEALVRSLGTDGGRALGVLLGAAFPPLTPVHGWQLDALDVMARRGFRSQRSREFLIGRLRDELPTLDDAEHVKATLRRQSWAQRARIALREVLPRSLGGAAVDVTARELSHLAEAGFAVALAEAEAHATARFGTPRRADGAPSVLTVLGMGKLGGLELNAGSDVDVICIYDTDDGAAGDVSLH